MPQYVCSEQKHNIYLNQKLFATHEKINVM